MQASCGTGMEEETFECRCCCLVVADRECLAAFLAGGQRSNSLSKKCPQMGWRLPTSGVTVRLHRSPRPCW